MSALRDKYRKDVVPALREALGLTNPMQVPRLEKVVLNMGMGVADQDTQKSCLSDLTAIAGQRPVLTRARKSIANFKLREGMVVGACVTLRGARMYEFMERLIAAALPRIRDFRGVSPHGFDRGGNYTLGLKDQTIFPEIDPDKSKVTQGMDITVVTTATSRKEAFELLKRLGMPFSGGN